MPTSSDPIKKEPWELPMFLIRLPVNLHIEFTMYRNYILYLYTVYICVCIHYTIYVYSIQYVYTHTYRYMEIERVTYSGKYSIIGSVP